VIAVVLALTLSSPSAAAPYEPNDTIASATGPLLTGQTYEASLESATDRDFFYFYVTSPTPAQVTPTIKNLGNGPQAASINVTIVDFVGSALSPVAYYLSAGGEATGAASLGVQKYFLEVRPATEGAGSTSYSLAAAGSQGAFGSYAEIAARCAAGMEAVKTARSRVNRAQSKLHRATARLRQSRFGTPVELRAARKSFRKAKARTTGAQRTLKAKRSLLQPWCSVPQ
jgi:hypothetical protein